MDIPYSDFYASEFGTSPNAYEVDAVSSATTTKWSKNGEGELFEGTYNQANEDGTGTILGVTYPVAITQAELDSLGENNFNFTPADYEPVAYKTVSVADGKAVFSAVQDSTPEIISDASIKLSTATAWGDYLIDVENAPEIGIIYGAFIRTTDGNTYAMRHEENIWRGELAWSSGITTTEPHGNTLSYQNFESLMGATINEVIFITKDGYTIIPTDIYVPVKFNCEVRIENSTAGNGSTTIITDGFPEDYQKIYSVSGNNFTVNDSQISYTDVLSGEYTLIISDEGKKYADVTSNFILSTDTVPATYKDGKLIKSENTTDEEFANFINNISKVTVNGTDYKASGKGAVKIVGEDGTIDFNASSSAGNVFDGSGNYEIKVMATGYNTALEFKINTETNSKTETEPATTVTETTVSNSSVINTTNNSSQSDSPKTGIRGTAIPLAFLTIAGLTAIILKKKER
ncbi:MAG: hemoblobin-interacting domain-containing protein, partial [Ruminococcus sp.]